jgi:hypothetical protein
MVASAQGYNVNVKAGVDMMSEYSSFSIEGTDVNKKDADSIGFEIAVEGTKEVMSNLEAGLGIAYQRHGEVEAESPFGDKLFDSETIYDSIPVYALAKYTFKTYENKNFYVKGNLGYSFNLNEENLDWLGDTNVNSDVDNGLYWALGTGMEVDNWNVELMYQVNYADTEFSAEGESYSDDLDYSRITLSVGYEFDI